MKKQADYIKRIEISGCGDVKISRGNFALMLIF